MGDRVVWSKTFPMVLGAIIASSLVGIGPVWGEVEIPVGNLTGAAGEDVSANTGPQPPSTQALLSYDSGKPIELPGETKITRMPGHTAFRGLADSTQYKEMFKGMITSQVPVMFQTMMMVENGAMTGFIGSLQAVSNMLDGSIQSANLELAMRGVLGPDAQRQFVNAVHEGLKRNEGKSGENLWPVGLYYATGDQIAESLTDNKFKLEQKYQENQTKGATMVQHVSTDRRPQNNEDVDKATLWDFVFANGAGTGSSAADNRRDEQKKWAKEVVGDFKFERVQTNANPYNPRYEIKWTFVPPTLKAPIKQDNSFSAAVSGRFEVPDEVYGMNVKLHEIRKKTWTSMYLLLNNYCNFKKTNNNSGREIFDKWFAAEYIKSSTQMANALLENVSSNNLKVTVNMVDQVFKIWVQTSTDSTQPTKIDCDFQNAEQEMPENAEGNDGGDSCKGSDKAKKCRRNKFLYRLVDIIALDKLLDQAKDTYEAAMVNALTAGPSIAERVNTLFCNSLATNQNSDLNNSQCNIGFWLDSMAGFNRQRWSDQLESAAKLAQSLGGSSNFRFQPNNSLAVAGGGYDSAGDAGGEASTGGGGGGGS